MKIIVLADRPSFSRLLHVRKKFNYPPGSIVDSGTSTRIKEEYYSTRNCDERACSNQIKTPVTTYSALCLNGRVSFVAGLEVRDSARMNMLIESSPNVSPSNDSPPNHPTQPR